MRNLIEYYDFSFCVCEEKKKLRTPCLLNLRNKCNLNHIDFNYIGYIYQMIQSQEQNFKICNSQIKENTQMPFTQKGWKLRKVFGQEIEINWQLGVHLWCSFCPLKHIG